MTLPADPACETDKVDAPARPARRGTRKPFDEVSARLLVGFQNLCATLGGNPDDVLASVGLVGDDLAKPETTTTYQQHVDLLANAATMLAAPDFGMRLASGQRAIDIHGPLGKVMRHSRTLGDALAYVIENAHVHSTAARIARHAIPGRRGIVISHEIISGDLASQRQAKEHILLAGQRGTIALTGGRSRARRVMMRHGPISPSAVYRRYFGCEVLFDQPLDALIFSAQDLANPIAGRDPKLHAAAIAAIAARHPFHAPPIAIATRAVILRLMPVGQATNAHVASELGMHARTLHRQLTRAGTTFQQIKDEVRCELVRYYLSQTDLSFLAITGKLDFAEQAVFTRFCRRHLGMTPSDLRNQAITRVPGSH
jgi:AraC-like DNA-binding protein